MLQLRNDCGRVGVNEVEENIDDAASESSKNRELAFKTSKMLQRKRKTRGQLQETEWNVVDEVEPGEGKRVFRVQYERRVDRKVQEQD